MCAKQRTQVEIHGKFRQHFFLLHLVAFGLVWLVCAVHNISWKSWWCREEKCNFRLHRLKCGMNEDKNKYYSDAKFLFLLPLYEFRIRSSCLNWLTYVFTIVRMIFFIGKSWFCFRLFFLCVCFFSFVIFKPNCKHQKRRLQMYVLHWEFTCFNIFTLMLICPCASMYAVRRVFHIHFLKLHLLFCCCFSSFFFFFYLSLLLFNHTTHKQRIVLFAKWR